MQPFPYRIERLNDARLADVQRLLREVMGKSMSLDQVRIKYDTAYTGHQHLSSIAYDGEQPIAFYGAIPQVFKTTDGTWFVGCHLADCMTLEKYQRQGLHQRLGRQVYEWMQAEGVQVIYGFHSENTRRSSQKLGWTEGKRLRGYAIEAARLPFAQASGKVPGLRSWQLSRLKKSMAAFAIPSAGFPNSQAEEGTTVKYSPAFFDAKAFHPNFWIQLKGVRFWLGVEAIVRVGDVHFKDANQFWEGLEELRRMCKALGYRQILFQTYPDSRLDQALGMRLKGFESWMLGWLPMDPGFDFSAYRPNYGDQDSF
jgi:GNAT superfamily N-acetyltransferase